MLALQSLCERKKSGYETHIVSHALKAKQNKTIRNMANSRAPCSFLCIFAHLWWYAIEWLTRSSRIAVALNRLLLLPFIQPDDSFHSILHESVESFSVFLFFLSVILFSLLSLFFVVCQNWEVLHQKYNSIHAINMQAPKESKESMWNELRKTRFNAAIYSPPASQPASKHAYRLATDFDETCEKMSAKKPATHKENTRTRTQSLSVKFIRLTAANLINIYQCMWWW